MGLIGLPEAARRMDVRNSSTAKTSLERGGVNLQKINGRAWGVEESDLAKYIAERGEFKRGRPKKVTTA
jgi:hypothetical protein